MVETKVQVPTSLDELPKPRFRHLLGIEPLEAWEIWSFLHAAAFFKTHLQASQPSVSIPQLQGKSLVTLFYEPSTRTRTSFEMAARKLGMGVTHIAVAAASVVKGESLKDTVLTLYALGYDAFVIRHSHSGAPHFVARVLEERARQTNGKIPSVLNAGDGMHEHPTQALLDLLTMWEVFGRIEGLKVAFVGDILHSRVARSGMWALLKLGAEVRFVGPPTMVPEEFATFGVRICKTLPEAVSDVDVVYLLRLQLERQQAGLFPSVNEYHRLFGMDLGKLHDLCPQALVMHPGPMNRGVEIASDLADSEKARILDQVTNGVAVRMAVLWLLLSEH
jgi:aspartate carbamoyltransferase catalytic subunit